MKIQARASGGLAGRTEQYILDTTRIADGQALESLVGRLDFFDAKPRSVIGADLPRWDITVDDGRRCHTVAWHEDGSGGDWHRLVECLRRSA